MLALGLHTFELVFKNYGIGLLELLVLLFDTLEFNGGLRHSVLRCLVLLDGNVRTKIKGFIDPLILLQKVGFFVIRAVIVSFVIGLRVHQFLVIKLANTLVQLIALKSS